MKIDLLGLQINADTKQQVLADLQDRVVRNEKTFIVTPYSESFVRAFRDANFAETINSADLALPDGIGVLWLAYFLSKPFRLKKYYLKILEGIWQIISTGAQVILAPRKIKRIIPEKISGSDFFWDLVRFARKNDLRIYLLGGFGNTPEIVADKIRAHSPGIEVVGYSNAKNLKEHEDDEIQTINSAGTDILLVALGPVKQEKWIAKNLSKLNVKVVIGLGGTFDYVAGKRLQPPRMIRKIGLEWLYRLFTQPHRFARIWRGVVGLILGALRYKVFTNMPFRENVVGVIINANKQILTAKRVPEQHSEAWDPSHAQEHWQLPQGGVDKGENPQQAVLREMKEELGVSALKVLGKAKRLHTYTWNNTIRDLLFNRLKYKGQSQSIYFLRYSGKNDDIKIDNREFEDFKWVEKENLKSVIHPVRHKMLEIVLSDLDNYLQK